MDNFGKNNSTDKTNKDNLANQTANSKEVKQQNDDLKPDQPADDQPSKDVQDSVKPEKNYENIYAEDFKRFEEGEIVAGRIIAIDKDYVLVDIGYNSEGQIRIQEFKDDQGNITASQGDNVEVMVEYWDEVEECIILSKEKATKVKIREDIKNSLKDSALDYLFNKDVKVAKCPKCGLMAVIRGHKEIKISEETAYKIFTIRYCYKCNWRKEEEESYRDNFSDIQGPPRYEDEQERLRDIYGEGGFETEDGHFFPESWDPS